MMMASTTTVQLCNMNSHRVSTCNSFTLQGSRHRRTIMRDTRMSVLGVGCKTTTTTRTHIHTRGGHLVRQRHQVGTLVKDKCAHQQHVLTIPRAQKTGEEEGDQTTGKPEEPKITMGSLAELVGLGMGLPVPAKVEIDKDKGQVRMESKTKPQTIQRESFSSLSYNLPTTKEKKN